MRNRKPAVLLIGDDGNGNAASRQILEREGCAAHGASSVSPAVWMGCAGGGKPRQGRWTQRPISGRRAGTRPSPRRKAHSARRGEGRLQKIFQRG